MTQFFVGSTYQGIGFTTSQELLILIRDNLTTVGWTVELDDISANKTLQMKGYDEDNPSDSCYFTFLEDSVTFQVGVKGYLGDSADALEESSVFPFQYTDGAQNTLWMTADSGSACIMVLDGPTGLTVKSIPYTIHANGLNAFWFGFFKRVAFYDKYAWGIGRIDYRYNMVEMSRMFTGLEDPWINIGTKFYNNTNDYSSNYLRVPVTTFDPIMYAHRYSSFRNQGDDRTTSNNIFQTANRGSVNAVDGLPYFGPYYYIEGRKDDSGSDDYGDLLITKPYAYRGNVKYAATGLASMLALEMYQDRYGKIWISTNNYGAQAMQLG